MDRMALDDLDAWIGKTQRKTLAEIQSTTVDGRRLVSFRRLLTFLLVVTGAPVLALERSSAPGIRRVLAILAGLWLSVFLPMVCVLYLEWQNRRKMERLRARAGEPANQAVWNGRGLGMTTQRLL